MSQFSICFHATFPEVARWLCSGLPGYFIEGPINLDDKDTLIRLIGKWIWEVAELGATTRKADREALKDFITKAQVTVRKSYGRHDINKPAMASLIGTINNEGGFLSDPTGNRRFLVCTLADIGKEYSQEVNPNQLWAQAFALYQAGEPWQLTAEERERQKIINRGYEVEDALEGYLRRVCEVEPSDTTLWAPTTSIVMALISAGYRGGSSRQIQMELAATAKRLGLKKGRQEADEGRAMGYYGLQLRPGREALS